jgi:hypothetical protein
MNEEEKGNANKPVYQPNCPDIRQGTTPACNMLEL